MESSQPEQVPESDFFKKRKLASVQKISSLTPLDQKNLCQKATILGWNVVVDYNKFQVGEKVIYFEADSLLPAKKKWTKGIKPKQLRIKTFSRYNEVFHGTIMKLDTLTKVENFNLKLEDLEEGFDLTEILEVTKYDEDSEQAIKDKEKKFPSEIIEKSDEIRLQSNPKYFELFEGKEFYSSLKYDGSSGTFLIHPETKNFMVCSRNQTIDENEKKNIYWDVANKYDIKTKLEKFEGKYAIQGEIYGPKINKNRLGEKDIKIAKEFYHTSITSIEENPMNIIREYLTEEMTGLAPYEERLKIMSKVTKSDIVKAYKKIKMDTIFLLEGDIDEAN